MREQVGCFSYGEGLACRLDAAVVAAVQLALLGRVGHPDAPIGSFHDVELFVEPVGECEHVGIHAGLDPVIGLHDGDPSAGCFLQTAVACGPVPFVLLVDHANAVVLSGVRLHGLQRVVRTAIVQADNFKVTMCLRQDAVQALLEVRPRVEDGDDNGDKLVVCGHAFCSLSR